MNWAQAAPYAALGLAVAVPGWRTLLATLRATRTPAPAASPRPVPASPGAGAAAGPAKPASPLAGGPGTGPQRTLSVDYYDDGHAEVLFHRTRRRIYVRGEPLRIDLSDAALKGFLDEQR